MKKKNYLGLVILAMITLVGCQKEPLEVDQRQNNVKNYNFTKGADEDSEDESIIFENKMQWAAFITGAYHSPSSGSNSRSSRAYGRWKYGKTKRFVKCWL